MLTPTLSAMSLVLEALTTHAAYNRSVECHLTLTPCCAVERREWLYSLLLLSSRQKQFRSPLVRTAACFCWRLLVPTRQKNQAPNFPQTCLLACFIGMALCRYTIQQQYMRRLIIVFHFFAILAVEGAPKSRISKILSWN